jgi:hypothetical protein
MVLAVGKKTDVSEERIISIFSVGNQLPATSFMLG